MRTVVLGASGMLGHQLWRHLSSSRIETFGVIRKTRSACRHGGLFNSDRLIENVDASNFNDLRKVLENIKPEYVLNCIGITKRRVNSDNVAECIRMNALLPHELVGWGGYIGYKVINFSTDCVFDGKQGDYTEDSPTSPGDLYGRTKALGELTSDKVLTIRSSFIGPELYDGTELFEWFISRRGIVNGYTNAIYSGLTTLELSRIIEMMLIAHPDSSGLYNISSEPISKFALLEKIMQHMALPIELVPDGAFKCDRSLNSQRFRNEYNYQPPSWNEMVAELTTYMQQRKEDDF